MNFPSRLNVIKARYYPNGISQDNARDDGNII
jgi:hypothetical protein